MAGKREFSLSFPPMTSRGKEEIKSDAIEKYDPLIFCRTCANADTCLVPIFSGDGLNYSLHQKIEKYLPIRVSEEDDLPLHLCYHCVATLIAWDTLIVGCIEAEKKLNSIKNNQTKQIVDASVDLSNGSNFDSDDEPLIVKLKNKNVTDFQKLDRVLDENNILLDQGDFNDRREKKLSVILAADSLDTRDVGRLELVCDRSDDASNSDSESAFGKFSKNEHSRTSLARGKKLFKCDTCERVFNRKYNFERHFIVHSDEFFTCRICGKQYRRRSVLDRHVKVVHQRMRMAHLSCNFCGKMFSSTQSLEDHLRTHTGERPFICEVCGKDFRARPNLIAHKKIHTGELPFACALCDYRCRLKSTFVDHCQRHEGTRTCLCSVCGKGFVNNYDLMKHKKTHSKERRFACEFCHLTFVMKRYLKVHLRTHAHKETLT